METVTHVLLNFHISLKIYHWQTTIFARHNATDKLYEIMSTLIDKFVEILQGKRNSRIEFKNTYTIRLKNFGDGGGKKLLLDFKTWLENDLPSYLTSTDTDLLNLRDEMVGEVNKTLYLFTMK